MELGNLNNEQLNHLRQAVYKVADAMSALGDLNATVTATSKSVGMDVTAIHLDEMRAYLNNTPHLAQLLQAL